MPILVPKPSQHTVREFVFQIVTITVGILIALSIDGFVEWSRQRSVVREAHAVIRQEIADNLRDVRETLPDLETYARNLSQALQLVDDLRTKGKSSIAELQLQYRTPSLISVSWEAADRTGALAFMDYGDVQEYGEVYDLQDLVEQFQDQQLSRVSRLNALFAGWTAGEARDLLGGARVPPPNLDAVRVEVLEAMVAAQIHKALARQLVSRYELAPAQ